MLSGSETSDICHTAAGGLGRGLGWAWPRPLIAQQNNHKPPSQTVHCSLVLSILRTTAKTSIAFSDAVALPFANGVSWPSETQISNTVIAEYNMYLLFGGLCLKCKEGVDLELWGINLHGQHLQRWRRCSVTDWPILFHKVIDSYWKQIPKET